LDLSKKELTKYPKSSLIVVCTDNRTKELKSLDLSGNLTIEQLFVEDSPKLTFLDISRCDSLHQILIRGQSLQQLKIGSLSSLSHLILDTNCIQQIDTNDFRNLKSFNMKSSALTTIFFANDNKIEEISLDCPNLTNLDELSKCSSLERCKLINLNSSSFQFELAVDTGPLSELTISSDILDNLVVLTASNLRKFELNCPKLTKLELYRFCSTLSSSKNVTIGLQCPLLKQTHVRGYCTKWFSKYFPSVVDTDNDE
jgi:hypothetical protein